MLAMTQCSCHREERGDLAFPKLANIKERLLRRLAMTILLSSRGTKRSRFSRAGKQRKERLPRFARNDKTLQARNDKNTPTHNSQKRDCRAALAMTKDCRLATPQGGFDKIQPRFAHDDKNTADSKQPKERLLRRLAMTDKRCHREVRSDLALNCHCERSAAISHLTVIASGARQSRT